MGAASESHPGVGRFGFGHGRISDDCGSCKVKLTYIEGGGNTRGVLLGFKVRVCPCPCSAFFLYIAFS